MTQNESKPAWNRTETDWAVEYDVEPIRIRDPVAEALGVLEDGEPFVISYEDIVKAAGHSCPTAAGAFMIGKLGLEALYPNANPRRSDIDVVAAGPRDDPAYGVTGRLLSYITGAAGEDGFGGLAGGFGNRRERLAYDGFESVTAGPTFRFHRRSDDAVQVTYHVGEVPDGGPAIENLRRIVDGSASQEEKEAFAAAWHEMVRGVLGNDTLFSVDSFET